MKPPASDPSSHGSDEIDPLDLEVLHDLLDERLDAAASAALRARLEREPGLRAAWHELCELRELLREEWSDETPTPLDPRALADRVLDRAREQVPLAPAVESRSGPSAAPVLHGSRWFRFGLSCVAAASVCAAAVWLASPPQESALDERVEGSVDERHEVLVRADDDQLDRPDPASVALVTSGDQLLRKEGLTKARGATPSSAPSPTSAAPAADDDKEPGRLGGRNGSPASEPEPRSSSRETRENESSPQAEGGAVVGGLSGEAPDLLRLGAGATPGRSGGGEGGVPNPEAKDEAPSERPASAYRWQDSAGEALRFALGSFLQDEVVPGDAAPAAPKMQRLDLELEELAAAELEAQVPRPLEIQSAVWLEDAARSLVRQLDVDLSGLQGSGNDEKSADPELGELSRSQDSEASKSKQAVTSVAVPELLWARLERRWSETAPSAELAKQDAGVDRSRSLERASEGRKRHSSDAEPVLVLHYRQLAPAQIAKATAALQSRGLVEGGRGLLLHDKLSFRSVLSPVETMANAPSVFVGWVEMPTPMEATPELKRTFGYAGSPVTDQDLSQRLVLFAELERAIAAAQESQDLARDRAPAPVQPSGASVASKEAESRGPDPTSRQSAGAAAAPGAPLDGQRERLSSEAKKLGAPPGGSAGPASSADRAGAPALERAPISDPAQPTQPLPTPPRAMRVLAILEPKRGG